MIAPLIAPLMDRRTLLGASVASAVALALPARAAAPPDAAPGASDAVENGSGNGAGRAPLEHAWETVDLSYVKRAPYVTISEVVLPASPLVVSRVLADPEPWPRWLPLTKGVEYRTPFGPGAERDVTVTGGVIRERFFLWDEGERLAFSVSSSTLPVGKVFFEDWLLKPVQGGKCRFIWTIAFEPQPWSAPLGPVLMSVFKAVTPSSLDRLAVIVEERAVRERAGRGT